MLECASELINDRHVLLKKSDLHLKLLQLSGGLVDFSLKVPILLLDQQSSR